MHIAKYFHMQLATDSIPTQNLFLKHRITFLELSKRHVRSNRHSVAQSPGRPNSVIYFVAGKCVAHFYAYDFVYE